MRIGVRITTAGIFIGIIEAALEMPNPTQLADPARVDLVPMGMPGRVPEAVQVATLRNVALLGVPVLDFHKTHIVAEQDYIIGDPESDGKPELPILVPPLVLLYLQSRKQEQGHRPAPLKQRIVS